MKLENDQHERFCQEYIIDLNGTQAAIRAKFSEKTARSKASQLLTKVNIQDRITELQAKRAKRTEITQDRVLKELAMIGFSDLKNYINIDENTGAIIAKGFNKMPKGESRVIKAIKENRAIKEDADGKKVTVYDKIEFVLHDKMRALELIGRHLKMFVDKLEHSGAIGLKLTAEDIFEALKAAEKIKK